VNENQQAAFIMSQSACALITAMGMQADNQRAAHEGEPPKYIGAAFDELIDSHGIGYNAVLGFWRGT